MLCVKGSFYNNEISYLSFVKHKENFPFGDLGNNETITTEVLLYQLKFFFCS